MKNTKVKHVSERSVRNAFTTTGLLLILYILIVLYIPTLVQKIVELRKENFFVQYRTVILWVYILLYSVGTLTLFIGILKVNDLRFRDFWRSCIYSFQDYIIDFSICLILLFTATYLVAMPLHLLGVADSALLPIGLHASFADLRHLDFLALYLFITPLIEELAFRGIFLRMLGRYGNRFALVAVSLFYAFAHVSLAEFVPAFVLSYYLGRITLLNHSVYPAVAIHLSYNAFVCLLSLISEKSFPIFALAMFAIFIAVCALIYWRGFRTLHFKKAQSLALLVKLYLCTPSMSVAFLLLLAHSVLGYILR